MSQRAHCVVVSVDLHKPGGCRPPLSACLIWSAPRWRDEDGVTTTLLCLLRATSTHPLAELAHSNCAMSGRKCNISTLMRAIKVKYVSVRRKKTHTQSVWPQTTRRRRTYERSSTSSMYEIVGGLDGIPVARWFRVHCIHWIPSSRHVMWWAYRSYQYSCLTEIHFSPFIEVRFTQRW